MNSCDDWFLNRDCESNYQCQNDMPKFKRYVNRGAANRVAENSPYYEWLQKNQYLNQTGNFDKLNSIVDIIEQ